MVCYAKFFTQEQFFQINELKGLGYQGLQERKFGSMAEGDARYIFDAISKEVQKLERETFLKGKNRRTN